MIKVIAHFIDLFRATPAQIISHQFEQAERLHLQHAAAEEHHRAMAKMYSERMGRLVESVPDDCPRHGAKDGAGRPIDPALMPMHVIGR